jgi:hypothetical protein
VSLEIHFDEVHSKAGLQGDFCTNHIIVAILVPDSDTETG